MGIVKVDPMVLGREENVGREQPFRESYHVPHTDAEECE